MKAASKRSESVLRVSFDQGEQLRQLEIPAMTADILASPSGVGISLFTPNAATSDMLCQDVWSPRSRDFCYLCHTPTKGVATVLANASSGPLAGSMTGRLVEAPRA